MRSRPSRRTCSPRTARPGRSSPRRPQALRAPPQATATPACSASSRAEFAGGAQAALVPAQAIRAFLSAQSVAPASSGADVKSAVVRVICVRK